MVANPDSGCGRSEQGAETGGSAGSRSTTWTGGQAHCQTPIPGTRQNRMRPRAPSTSTSGQAADTRARSVPYERHRRRRIPGQNQQRRRPAPGDRVTQGLRVQSIEFPYGAAARCEVFPQDADAGLPVDARLGRHGDVAVSRAQKEVAVHPPAVGLRRRHPRHVLRRLLGERVQHRRGAEERQTGRLRRGGGLLPAPAMVRCLRVTVGSAPPAAGSAPDDAREGDGDEDGRGKTEPGTADEERGSKQSRPNSVAVLGGEPHDEPSPPRSWVSR